MAKLYIWTPFAPVAWASLNKPGKPYEEGDEPMYELKLAATEAQITKFKADLLKLAGNPTFDSKKPMVGTSKDGEFITMKSKFKPLQTDAACNPLTNPRVAKDSIVRGYGELNIYKKGISLRLIEVQIKELVEYAAKDPDSPRASNATPVDGYVAGNEPAADEPEADTAPAGSALDI